MMSDTNINEIINTETVSNEESISVSEVSKDIQFNESSETKDIHDLNNQKQETTVESVSDPQMEVINKENQNEENINKDDTILVETDDKQQIEESSDVNSNEIQGYETENVNENENVNETETINQNDIVDISKDDNEVEVNNSEVNNSEANNSEANNSEVKEEKSQSTSNGWGWTSFYSSFKKATQVIAETSKESAKKYLTQLKEKSEEMMQEIKIEETKASTSIINLEKQAPLPWEGIEFASVQDDLKQAIFDLSKNDTTFTIGVNDKDFVFDMNSNIPVILKLRKMDPRISEARLRLVQTNLIKDDIFWMNYFSHINKVQNHYRDIIQTMKSLPVSQSVTPLSSKSPLSSTNDIHKMMNTSEARDQETQSPSITVSSIPSVGEDFDLDDLDTQLQELSQEGDDGDNEDNLDIDILEQDLRRELGMN